MSLTCLNSFFIYCLAFQAFSSWGSQARWSSCCLRQQESIPRNQSLLSAPVDYYGYILLIFFTVLYTWKKLSSLWDFSCFSPLYSTCREAVEWRMPLWGLTAWVECCFQHSGPESKSLNHSELVFLICKKHLLLWGFVESIHVRHL